MKSIAFLFAAFIATGLTFASQANACSNGFDSLQFGGYVRNVTKTATGCEFQIELDSKVSVPVAETSCPLSPGQVGTLKFQSAGCKVTEGAEISGVMELNRKTGETRF